MALARLEIGGTVEPLRRAYRACLERATPPDWSEPVGIRWALTELGARSPVVPPLTARLRATAADDSPGWPSTHFAEIINDLADHAQVILYSSSSPPPGSTVPTCTRRGDRCRSSTPRRSAMAT